MKKSLLLLIFLPFYTVVIGQIQLDSTTLDTTTLIKNIDIPWEILWGPDDFIWMTERYGRVSRVDPVSGNQEVLLDISNDVYENGEAGLLGMALHPDFANQPEVFLVHTYLSASNVREKMVRYDFNGSQLVNPFTIVDNIPGNSTHDGSRLLFLADTTLLMTTGDAQNQSLPQNVSSLAGKVLRYNTDGSIPADNPIPNSPVYTWGHRNAQGLALGPDGTVYSSEHGPTTDDEINIIMKGRNYGWPEVHGLCDAPNEMSFCVDSNVVEPILNWTPTIATSDIVWYGSSAIPEFQNTILLAVLKNKRIKSIKLNQAGTQVDEENDYFQNIWGRIRDICVSPDGELFIATNGQNWNNSDPFSHSIIKMYNANHPVGMREINHTADIAIYPQPADDLLTIYSNYFSEPLQIEILNSAGQLVRSKMMNEARIGLDLSDVPGGIYFIKASSGDSMTMQKLILR